MKFANKLQFLQACSSPAAAAAAAAAAEDAAAAADDDDDDDDAAAAAAAAADAAAAAAAAADAAAAAATVWEVLQPCGRARHLLGTPKYGLDLYATRFKGAARQQLTTCGCDVVAELFSARPCVSNCDMWLTLSCLV